jgi:hypothetical protein
VLFQQEGCFLTALSFVAKLHNKICQQVASAGPTDSTYRHSILLVLKTPQEGCMPELQIGSITHITPGCRGTHKRPKVKL